ncbi:group II trans-sialidase superfamily [Trypanosoma rangeli]|uniref:Group II trans-sialidase superfamily n=1 Tax=Trypanosoma rangeli TaxID=5698 RepID=A0A3R7M7R8_TRYRA|nr:group II trans-sialidase superfamily [Trypanosoma rangeli]RNF10607.1 group II trans-sialidase superfamily [Trypanosoma rangeli]|eukprot:RNF10607.1 group II trans-sialidase superfamily [Trypanosoma rangeli]
MRQDYMFMPRATYAVRPTTIAKGNKVFLLVGGYHKKYDPSSKKWTKVSQGLDLLVGEATQDKVIQWGEPTSLVPQIEPSAKQRGLDQFVGGGGSGVVMEDDTFVFAMTARRTGDKRKRNCLHDHLFEGRRQKKKNGKHDGGKVDTSASYYDPNARKTSGRERRECF